MVKAFSKIGEVIGRLMKAVVVIILVPLAIGLLLGILEQLELTRIGSHSARQLVTWGFSAYVAIHIILYRPETLFQLSRRVFSAIAVWLFGGQVSSVEERGGGKAKSGKAGKASASAQGSPLVAFSPYVIPSYLALVCGSAWIAARWMSHWRLDAAISVLIGMTIAFHWLMTADELQEQRKQWHVETYLLAIGLVFVLTLIIGGACLPLALPEFSFVRALGDGVARAQMMYAAIIQRLFL